MSKKNIIRTTLSLLTVCMLCAPVANAVAATETRIPFASPALKADQMPQVFFSHEKHVAALEEKNMDCTSCHVYTDEGFSTAFLKSASLPADKQVAYVHDNCVKCHAEMAAPTGPALTSCRSCHSESIAAAQVKK